MDLPSRPRPRRSVAASQPTRVIGWISVMLVLVLSPACLEAVSGPSASGINVPNSQVVPEECENSVSENLDAASSPLTNETLSGEARNSTKKIKSEISKGNKKRSKDKRKKNNQAKLATSKGKKQKSKPSEPKSAAAPKSYTQKSSTHQRIKEEYKDAVRMGIAYDWVKGRPVKQSKSKSKKRKDSSSGLDLRLRLGPTSNMFHWQFSFVGLHQYKGIYHGRISLPRDFPANPPKVQLWTPSGRFIPYTDICLSASSYHPESWSPRWTILSLIQGLRLHMLTNPQEIGGIGRTPDEIADLARKSLTWKISSTSGNKVFQVDHAQMLVQGALSLENEDDEKSPNNSMELVEDSDTQTAEKVEPIKKSNANEDASESSTSMAISTDDDASLVKKSGKKKSTRSKPKSKSRSKSPPKGKKTKVSKTRVQVAKRDETPGWFAELQRNELTRQFLVILSRLISSPTRIALLSFFLLVWLIRIP